jgi:long-chain acyl-CoA synthetase
MIASAFDAAAAAHPTRLALRDGNISLSYAELALLRDRLCSTLRERLALQAGARVGLALRNRWEMAAGILALAKLGCVSVLVNPQWRRHELAELRGRLDLSAALVEPGQEAVWNELAPAGIPLATPADLGAPAAEARADTPAAAGPLLLDRDAVFLLTSGSTGCPKVVPRSHANLVHGCRNVDAALGGLSGMRCLAVVPWHHANGFANCLLLPLLAGASIVVMNGFAPARLLEHLRHDDIQVLVGSPFVFSALCRSAELRAGDLASLKICLSSGAPLVPELARTCRESLGVRVRQLYGSSETGTISIEAPGTPVAELTAGIPIRGVKVRIDPIAGGHADLGEVLVKSPAMMRGYVAEEDSRLSPDGFFRTGDLGRIDAQGRLVLGGRLRPVINLCGIKVDAVEIEAVIGRMPGVCACGVSGAPGPDGGELIRAVVAVRAGTALQRSEVVAWCREHLAEYKIPRSIELVEAPAADATGKRACWSGPAGAAWASGGTAPASSDVEDEA